MNACDRPSASDGAGHRHGVSVDRAAAVPGPAGGPDPDASTRVGAHARRRDAPRHRGAGLRPRGSRADGVLGGFRPSFHGARSPGRVDPTHRRAPHSRTGGRASATAWASRSRGTECRGGRIARRPGDRAALLAGAAGPPIGHAGRSLRTEGRYARRGLPPPGAARRSAGGGPAPERAGRRLPAEFHEGWIDRPSLVGSWPWLAAGSRVRRGAVPLERAAPRTGVGRWAWARWRAAPRRRPCRCGHAGGEAARASSAGRADRPPPPPRFEARRNGAAGARRAASRQPRHRPDGAERGEPPDARWLRTAASRDGVFPRRR